MKHIIAVVICVVAGALGPKPSRAADANAPGTGNAAKPRTYESIAEVIRQLPEDLRQTTRGWDKFQFAKVQQWLRDHVIGSKLRATTPARVQRVVHLEGAKPGEDWQVTVRYGVGEKFTTGKRVTNAVEWKGLTGSYLFTCSEMIAKEWDQRGKQTFQVTVFALIDNVDAQEQILLPNGVEKDKIWVYSFSVSLADQEVLLPFRTALRPATPVPVISKPTVPTGTQRLATQPTSPPSLVTHAPPAGSAATRPAVLSGKKVVYVLQMGGSMLFQFPEARRLISDSIESLPTADSFNLYLDQENNPRRSLSSTFVQATPEGKLLAVSFLEDKLVARGESTIERALQKAIQDDPDTIWVLSNGWIAKPERTRILNLVNTTSFKGKINGAVIASQEVSKEDAARFLLDVCRPSKGICIDIEGEKIDDP